MRVEIKKNVLLSLILLFSFTMASSQDDPYRAEIGVQGGLISYLGDVNTIADPGNLLRNAGNMSGTAGAMFRYRINKRLAVRAGYDFGKVKGEYQFRDGTEQFRIGLNNSLHLIDLWAEFNFFDLENNPHKAFSKRYSPFIFAGAGSVLMPDYKDGASFGMTLPFGVGFKWKMSDRMNFNIQLTNRLAFNDGLEGLKEWDNPPPLTDNNLMNNDFTSALSIGFTYDFWTRGCDCRETTFSSGKKPAANKIKRQRQEKEKKSRRK